MTASRARRGQLGCLRRDPVGPRTSGWRKRRISGNGGGRRVAAAGQRRAEVLVSRPADAGVTTLITSAERGSWLEPADSLSEGLVTIRTSAATATIATIAA